MSDIFLRRSPKNARRSSQIGGRRPRPGAGVKGPLLDWIATIELYGQDVLSADFQDIIRTHSSSMVERS